MTNYKNLGLKAGLEIHQQLDTEHKLFCNCSTTMQEKDPIEIIKRKQHPVASELGEIDIAAQHEYLRDRTFNYQVFPKEVCLVCIDEEPPHELNQQALHIALQIALMLNCEIPNEIHIMRKTVTDGSNTTAFQRTAVVGLNGFLNYKGKKIEIKHVSLEEDAAAIVKEESGNIVYRLNRLGVPLVEIATGLLIGYIPEEIEDIAYHIGMLCRSTSSVKRGIGSIRQDVNVSIKVGERTEIKGIQELGLLSKIVENEVSRQLSLVEIRNDLRKRKIRRISSEPIDVNNFFIETKSKILRSIIDNKGNVFAIILNGFAGLLEKEVCIGKTLGRELAEYVAVFGVKGIIHSDEELGKYQLDEDFDKLKGFIKAKSDDAIVLIGEFKSKGKVAKALIEKCNRILAGPEKETRATEADGNTRYTRPLPGAARMYVETDVVPISISKETIDKIKKNLPEPWTKKLNKLKQLKLSDQLAKQILRSDYLELFEKIVKNKRIEASVVANVFVNTLKDLEKRDRVDVQQLTEKHFMEVFDYLARKKIVKEALPEILKYLANKPQETTASAVKSLNLTAISTSKLKEIIKQIVEQPNMNFDKAVGIVMSKVRGRIEAEVVMRQVKKMMK